MHLPGSDQRHLGQVGLGESGQVGSNQISSAIEAGSGKKAIGSGKKMVGSGQQGPKSGQNIIGWGKDAIGSGGSWGVGSGILGIGLICNGS
jgi:hypothetical protein